jgi:hypothetical protein
MSEQERNIEHVKKGYEAFSGGDIDTLMALVLLRIRVLEIRRTASHVKPKIQLAKTRPSPQARLDAGCWMLDGRLVRFVYPLLDLHICIRVGAVREGVHA